MARSKTAPAPRPARGHWPASKRRNVSDDKADEVLAEVREVLETRAESGVVSRRTLAAALGVTDRTVRRWLSREDNPPQAMLRRLKTWVRRVTSRPVPEE